MARNKHIPIKIDDHSLTWPGGGQAGATPQWQPDGPNLRFKELLRVTRVSKSKAYELFKKDPAFPKGAPLYDSKNSPKVYLVSDALAWNEMRRNKSRNSKFSTK